MSTQDFKDYMDLTRQACNAVEEATNALKRGDKDGYIILIRKASLYGFEAQAILDELNAAHKV
ncbi:MAG: hypothetical protein QM703_27140 [Gemmatales bacterium]